MTVFGGTCVGPTARFCSGGQLALLRFIHTVLGSRPLPTASDFVAALFLTSHGLGLPVAGTVLGGLLAALVLSISVSVPPLMTRRVDTVTGEP